MKRYIVTGLENGQKRSLTWLDGNLIGDDDLKTRFQKAWGAVDLEQYRQNLNEFFREAWASHLARQILETLFDETLDLEYGDLSTPEQLQAKADSWNSEGGDHHYKVEDMRRMEETQNWHNHHGPPFSWGEIETSLAHHQKIRSKPPKNYPKCLECLRPMEWIYFVSSPGTWKMLCGCAGWTAICRDCKTWRACQVDTMN